MQATDCLSPHQRAKHQSGFKANLRQYAIFFAENLSNQLPYGCRSDSLIYGRYLTDGFYVQSVKHRAFLGYIGQ